MTYSTFNPDSFDARLEPMFFGKSVNVSRYDVQKHSIFEKLIQKQLAFFWRPEEVDLTKDRKDFAQLSAHEKHIFLSNLQYQTLLDSIQGRSPNLAFLPLVSLPELETWIETWAFSETIHSRSYTHIVRNIINDPSNTFKNIIENQAIIDRAGNITKYYDKLIMMIQLYQIYGEGEYKIDNFNIEITKYNMKKQLYLTMVAVNVLESIRFYASFACSFAFAERCIMEGNAKIIKLIARDESLHVTGTQHMLSIMASGNDDPEMATVAKECYNEAVNIFNEAINQEKQWAKYLFKDGSMIGINQEILCQYVEYIAIQQMDILNFKHSFISTQNPLPWINSWLKTDTVQEAPQEIEVGSYLTEQIESNLEEHDFIDFAL